MLKNEMHSDGFNLVIIFNMPFPNVILRTSDIIAFYFSDKYTCRRHEQAYRKYVETIFLRDSEHYIAQKNKKKLNRSRKVSLFSEKLNNMEAEKYNNAM